MTEKRATNTTMLAWTVWACGTAFYFYSCFHRVAPGVMTDSLMADFGITAAALGFLSGAYFYIYAGLQIPAGFLLDRFGARKVLSWSAAFMVTGSFVFTYGETFSLAVFGRMMVGAGAAFAWIGTLRLITMWFNKNQFATLSGLALAIGLSGAIFGQAPLAAALQHYSWQQVMLVVSAIGLPLIVAFAFLVREPEKATTTRPVIENEAGILGGFFSSFKKVSKNPQTWYAIGYGAPTNTILWAFAALWAVPSLMSVCDFSKEQAAGLASATMIGGIFGAPALGFLSDKIGSRKKPMIGAGLVELVCFCFLFYGPTPSLWLATVFMFLLGFTASGSVLCFTCVKESNPTKMAGMAVGISNMFLMGSCAIYQPFVGKMLDIFWSGTTGANNVPIYSPEDYQAGLAVFPIGILIGLVLIFFYKDVHKEPEA